MESYDVNGWGRVSAAVLEDEAKRGDVAVEQLLVNVFGENIGWIFRPEDFLEGEVPGSQPVLNPQVSCRQVPYFPRPLRRHTPMAADASDLILSAHFMPRSAATDTNPREMDVPLQMPTTSASAELSVTVG